MESTAIHRHKTAIRRGDFSRPVKCLLRDGLIDKGGTFFDYGCGRGEDIELLTAEGITCSGWDPAYRPDAPRQEADVVNLGYVINVIENPEERAATLRGAWGLCRQLLAVSAQVLVAGRGKEPVEFGDGVLTGRGTFQKFYDQTEFKSYLEAQQGYELDGHAFVFEPLAGPDAVAVALQTKIQTKICQPFGFSVQQA